MNRHNRSGRNYIFRLLLLWGLTQALLFCSEPPPLKLTLEQREWVDTLYLRQVEGLGARLDSQCLERREKELQALADSIVAVRRHEEELLRAKYQQ